MWQRTWGTLAAAAYSPGGECHFAHHGGCFGFLCFLGGFGFFSFFSVVGDLKSRSWNSAAIKLPSCLGDQQEGVGGLCIPQCWQERFFFFCQKLPDMHKIEECSTNIYLQKTARNKKKKTLVEHLRTLSCSKNEIEITQKTWRLILSWMEI